MNGTDNDSFWEKYAWAITTFAPLLPNVLGSVFNVWYNVTNIKPLLSATQLERFMAVVNSYNAIMYPALVFLYVRWILSVRSTYHALRDKQPVDADRLLSDQRKVINSPWAIVTIGCIGWFLCLPVFLVFMYTGPEPVHPHLMIHLPISFLIAGTIAIAQSLFVSELCGMRLLHPTFFPNGGAAQVEGGYSLTLAKKGIVWAISVVVCPVVSLLMLIVAPQNVDWIMLFAMSVSMVAITFGLASAWLMAQLVTEPVNELRHAAERVAAGDLNAKVQLSRADDFGPLIDQFNRMVAGLKQKDVVQKTFGRHVGEAAAREILSSDAGLTGKEKVVTVMFADLRNFTTISSERPADEVVKLLNLFLTDVVEIVEHHNGIVNKYLGDGFMALFGAIGESDSHADDGLAAGKDIVAAMAHINQHISAVSSVKLSVGVGLHSGTAIIGSIGSLKRLEYTAIGDTVNVASRVESLTKQMGESLLISQATFDLLKNPANCRKLPPQAIKGKSEPIVIFSPDIS